MRLQTLELIRYGKFSDRKLHFPTADCDFHLIVGANEAGKSTLRRAVSELLFGMPLRSDMDFLHPLADLRVGAVIESAVGALAFHRSRGRKSLRRHDDEVLPDAALAEHLGSTSEALFKRMFCLDLNELLAGGQSILDAADDVGQLLFQSASGLSNLGTVRDALIEEANKLYAPRRAGDRAFYQALDRYDEAKQALRGFTVKTTQWTAAMNRVESLRASQREAAEQYRAQSASRQQLERIRRLAPRIAQLLDVQAQWEALAGTIEFPQDAAQRFAEAEEAMAIQTAKLDLHKASVASLQAQFAELVLDDAILVQAVSVESLAAQGHACAQHRQKIADAEQELRALLRAATEHAIQLKWPDDAVALRAQVPTALALKTLATVLEERSALLQAQHSAQAARNRAQAALERLQSQDEAPAQVLSPGLADALQAAQAWKTSQTRQAALQAELSKAENQRDAAFAALSSWRMEAAALMALRLPAEEHLAALKAERAALVNSLDNIRQQHVQGQEQARQSEWALAQFAASHSVVSLDDVHQARVLRDALWERIKEAQEPLASGAPQLDRAIAEADRLVDRQRDHAEDAATLLGLRQAHERDVAMLAAHERQLVDTEQALGAFETRWTEQAEAMGLPGMPLLDLSAWLLKREAALTAESDVQTRAAALAAEQAGERAARADLLAALPQSVVTDLDGETLPALCSRADRLIRAQQAAMASAEQGARQRAEALSELAHQDQALLACHAAMAQWQVRWDGAVQAAAFAGDWLTPDSARHAIDVAERVLESLAQADTLRQRHLDVMQGELAAFEAAVQALWPSLGGEGDQGCRDAFVQVHAWTQRLQSARDVQQARIRLQEAIRSSAAQVADAEAALASTRASLSSLHALAQSEDPAIVQAHIAASDRRRELYSALQQHRQTILHDGDGLSLDALLAECDAVAPEDLKPRLEAMDTELAAWVERQTGLAADLAQAQTELDKAQGGADAALAESKRLESLAQLGDAAERYMTVSAGHRLLRWAIDRYRERKQGPLLLRASELFSRLTLGGFARLSPDFEVTPPRLIAVRATGERVSIEGLSEGTRDQLFLALRLAALEMQIDNDRPLPFIADDLFVNFHDSRSRAGLAALGELARKTQVIFLTHHEHLVEVARECVGREINVVGLG